MARVPAAGAAEELGQGPFWAGWALRPASMDEVARQLGLDLERGQATRPDGSISSWRTAGPTSDLGGSLPFFIDYDDRADRLERFAASYAAAGHERPVGSIAWLEIEMDSEAGAESILARLTADVEIRLVEGISPGISAVGLRVDGEVIELPWT